MRSIVPTILVVTSRLFERDPSASGRTSRCCFVSGFLDAIVDSLYDWGDHGDRAAQSSFLLRVVTSTEQRALSMRSPRRFLSCLFLTALEILTGVVQSTRTPQSKWPAFICSAVDYSVPKDSFQDHGKSAKFQEGTIMTSSNILISYIAVASIVGTSVT